MRVAQISRLVEGGAARTEAGEIAKSLAMVGNRMWDNRLGVRDLGFPASVLRARPAVAGPVGEGDFVNPTTGPSSPPPVPVPAGVSPDPSAVPSATP
jgi:hypothetical protein